MTDKQYKSLENAVKTLILLVLASVAFVFHLGAYYLASLVF